MRSTPQQLLDAQMDLLSRWDIHGFDTWWLDTSAGVAKTPEVRQYLPFMTKEAQLYRISDDMSSLIEYSAARFEDDDTFDVDNAPSRYGMARFDRPLPMINTEGQTYLCHWIMWGISGQSALCFFINDLQTEPDDIGKIIMAQADWHRNNGRHIGRWGLLTGFAMATGAVVGPRRTNGNAQRIAELIEAGQEVHQPTTVLRYVHALWLQMQQKITTVEPEHVRKTTAQVARNRGVEPRVVAVNLRRPAGGNAQPAGTSNIEWSRRWVVNGHWRWQAHGPRRELRRRIWISDFIKGPEGKPLIVSPKIYDLKS